MLLWWRDRGAVRDATPHRDSALAGVDQVDPIYAYIDPGSGSLIIQAVIAGLVAIPIFFRTRIARFVRTLRGDSGGSATETPRDDAGRDA
jgi:hypothetical protein